jgi:predicted Zn finger-like uncharacterized protein
MFRVVSDQLKLRGGLVRCGSCRHVFDAIGSLSYIEESTLAATPTPVAPAAAAPAVPAPTPTAPSSGRPAPAPAPSAEATVPASPAATARNAGVAAAEGAQPRERARPLPEAVGAVAPTPTRRDEARSPVPDPLSVPTLLAGSASADAAQDSGQESAAPSAAEGSDVRTAPRAAAAAAGATVQPVARTAGKTAASTAEEAPEEQATADDADEVAFLRDTRPSHGFSIVYGGGSLLLALLMLVQSAVLFRTELLTRWPELRPRLVDICELYGCTVGWPTRADLLAVVGTELQAVPGTDILELTAVIRSRAPFRVALPAVEVTLTDTANRTLARKVFAPVDYLASNGEPSSRISEGLGPGSDYVVRISFEARGLNAAGFVVYPFYL